MTSSQTDYFLPYLTYAHFYAPYWVIVILGILVYCELKSNKSYTASIIADKLITLNILTATKTRKIFNSLGLFIPMFLTIGITFIDCSVPYDGVVLLTLGIGAL